jgi:hypothetical protein
MVGEGEAEVEMADKVVVVVMGLPSCVCVVVMERTSTSLEHERFMDLLYNVFPVAVATVIIHPDGDTRLAGWVLSNIRSASLVIEQ